MRWQTENPEPILQRAKEQLDAGAAYLDVNIGPAESTGEELMKWAVKLLQENFDNVPLSLDTANKKAIEAGISVYNRSKGKPIINSANAGDRIGNIDLAAANGAIVLSLCSKAGVPSNNDERMAYCQEMLERGMSLGMEAEDLWFDPLFLVIKGMQEKQLEMLEFIRMVYRHGPQDNRRRFQCFQRHAEEHPSDHEFRLDRNGNDERSHQRDRQPLRAAAE